MVRFLVLITLVFNQTFLASASVDGLPALLVNTHIQNNHDSLNVVLDSLIKKHASKYECRVTMKLRDANGQAYYTGFDGRNKQPITDFSGTIDIGSCTKMFTATAIIQLVEQKRLSLDDRLTALLPNPALYNGLLVVDGQDYIDSVTLRQLLNHTSGLPDYLGKNDELEIKQHGDSTLRFTPEELVMLAKKTNKPSGLPGHGFSYSNTNYILLGEILRKKTSKDYTLYFKQHILNPLGLTHTWYASKNPPAYRSPGYWQHQPSQMPASLAGPAGDLICTLDDMITFIDGWNKGLLFRKKETPAIVQKSNFNSMGPGIKYGLGVIDIMGKALGHAGQTFGFQSYMAATPTGACFAVGCDDAAANVWELAMAISAVLN